MGRIDWRVKALGLGGMGLGAESSIIDVDVDENKIIRTRPLHYRGDGNVGEYEPWTIDARGSVFTTLRKQATPPLALVYPKSRAQSPNRIPYPLKRVDWDPNGERNPQNRGKSKYERISWDEALDIIVAEIKRITETYGPYAIMAAGDGHGESKIVHPSHSNNMKLLHKLNGGFTCQARNPDSWEGWYWGARHLWGMRMGQPLNGNTLLDMAENTDTLLHWGCDLETTPWGWGDLMGSSYTFWLSSIGVRQIFISPDLNYSGACHSDRWIPVLPNTDTALQLAIAYVWLDEGTYDKAYCDTHVVGLDWMEYYIFGREDGIPKTPEWAEEKCGVPARIIRALARHWAKHNVSIAHVNGGSYIRSCFSTEPARMEGVLMGMQALGAPGRNVTKFIEWMGFGAASYNPAPQKARTPNVGVSYNGFAINNTDNYDIRYSFVPKTMIPKALRGEDMDWYGVGLAGWPIADNFKHFKFPNAIGKNTKIHMYWTDTPCWTTCWNGGNDFIDSIRSENIEFVLVQHPWMENDCLLGDVILPTCTTMEVTDITCDYEQGQSAMLVYAEACLEKYGESMSDWEAVGEIAKRFGIYEDYAEMGLTEEECLQHTWDNAGYADACTYEQFKKDKYIGFGPDPNWKENPRGLQLFYEDPDNNPVDTPSGKLEFYSSAIAQTWPDDKERGPYPKWIEETDRHHERLTNERGKEYPFLLESNHPRWRVHANLDDAKWLREIQTCKVVGPDGYQYEPAWLNPADAEKLGVETGDVVKIYNERGWTLGGVYVTERIMPRTVYQDHGARRDPVGEHGDRGGANNIIAPSECCTENAPGEVTSGFLVGVEKVDVFELAKQYPEEFGRNITPGQGVCVDNYLA